MADTNQPQPLQQTQPVHLDPERERFLIELEFVQSFANPFYITYLAQKGFLDNPAFVNYLKYLQYWKRPEYAKFIIYPHSLFFLDLLQNQLFRDKMKDELNAEKLHSTQFYHRFAWDSLQVRSSGGKLDPYVEAQRQLEELEREQLQKQAGNGIISGNTQQQLLNGMQPGAVDGHPSTGRMAVHGAAPISGSGQAQNVVNGRIK
ncbi:hypothetical protein G9A89_017981 [Geosiphon pyriformis]|nr:hypothetical protein G9A89_017981 [Geosiphon pyriformis]